MIHENAYAIRGEVARLGRLLSSNDEIEGAARLAELWPNVRAAVDWGLAVEDRDLVTAVLRPIALQLFVRRGLSEIADWTERLLAITTADDEDTIGFGLLWAAMHYSMTQDRDGFSQLIERSGATDHLFVRYAYLVGVEDNDYSVLEVGPLVVARCVVVAKRPTHVCIEFVNMMTAIERLVDAGVILGHLDATGMLGVEGPGFKLFVAEAAEVVAADPDASAAREDAAACGLGDSEALSNMGRALGELLHTKSPSV